MTNSLVEQLAGYLKLSTLLQPGAGPPDAWKLDNLDSLDMLQLITWLEGQFGIKVREQDIRPEHFGTVGDLARYVARRKG